MLYYQEICFISIPITTKNSR